MGVIFKKYFRYWNTLRYLRPVQISNRILRRFRRVKVDIEFDLNLRDRDKSWTAPAMRRQRMISVNEFCFLNESHLVEKESDWNNHQRSKLWLYNLHYFDDLVAVDANKRTEWHRGLIQKWVIQNPAGFGNGWEPYPSSLRIVNWIKWSLAGNDLEDSWLRSLMTQVHVLSQNLETHLLGNHLFANAKALLFAGLFFQGKEADDWFNTGLKIVERESLEQVLNDGGNFELSTMYHEIFLEDLLDIYNISRSYGRDVPANIELAIPKMIHWLMVLCHPDGEISLFNDAAIGVTPSPSELFGYASRIGFEAPRLGAKLIDLSDSGYSRVEVDGAVILIDRAAVGPDYLPAHAHADTLSFEMSIFQKRVIVNSGTSVYGTGKERQRQRSTAAHSTVVLNKESSSEVWGGFRVARRAKIFKRKNQENSIIVLSACHDGYKRLSGSPVHCRVWDISNSEMSIHDKITGVGKHDVKVVFFLHPDVAINAICEQRIELLVDGKVVELLCTGNGKLNIENSTYHPEFGLSVDNKKLIYHINCDLPIEITTKIAWHNKGLKVNLK